MSVIIANRTGEIDSSFHSLVKHINSPIPIVMVSWSENFVFDDDLLNLKDYCLICFCEYGWDVVLTESHIWGLNSEKFPRYYTKDWVTFDKWVKNNPPKIFFKRELLKKDVTDTIKPIEYPCIVEPWPVQSKEEFDARPINAFQYWGRSNECRVRIHGEIWNHAFTKGFQPCDNVFYISHYLREEKGEKWITLWIPHWARVDIKELMPVNNLSKLSLSWPGAGFKCFRHSESPINSVMVMYRNAYAWTHEWDETNCILVASTREIIGIEKALKRNDLYDVYVAGVLNANKYCLSNYLPYIEQTIKNAIS